MTKEKFLTIRWNNILTIGLGLPTLIYVMVAFSTGFWSTRAGLIGLALIGMLYGLMIEGHTAMRFAWLRKNTSDDDPVQPGSRQPLNVIRSAYNLAFWIFLLPFFTSMEYGTGFILFAIIILIRLVLNLYTNNVLELTPAQFESFPFRIGKDAGRYNGPQRLGNKRPINGTTRFQSQ